MSEAPVVGPEPRSPARARRTLVGVLVALAAGAVAYRLLVHHALEQTSALFIGVPTALAIFVALLPPPETAYGVTIKTTSLALLMSGILLGEGATCILFAAPLFFGVALLATAIVLWIRRRRERSRQLFASVVVLPLALSSVEGTRPELSFLRVEEVSAERVLPLPPEAVQASLAASPSFLAIPWELRIGFPRPVRTEGSGLAPGDRRRVHFAGGEGLPGTLEVEVVSSGPGAAVFAFPEDTSHIAHWLRWRRAEVRWRATDAGQTRVRFTLRYERLLDPAWYFGPIERVFVQRTADYLVRALAGAG